LLTIVP